MGGLRALSVATIAVALVTGGVVVAPVTAPMVSAAVTAPQPQVSGNQIVDARTGRTWIPYAVNWPSLEYACQQGWGYTQGGATTAAAAAMASWGINAVRLPLNEQCWLGTEGNPHYGTASGYRAAVRAFVDILNAHGLVVILDLHWTAPAGKQADGQRAMAGSGSVLFWQSVAAAYATLPSVMFDAFNEPYSRGAFTLTWSCWKSGGCQAPVENDQSSGVGGTTFTVAGMSTIVTTIRQAGANQPILLAGLDYANDLRGWLANRPADAQLIASWHNYPGQRCQQQSCWDSEIAPVAAQVPVMITEFGIVRSGGGGAPIDTLTPAMTWADTHGIGYSPWAWWVVDESESPSAALYALITDTTTFTPKQPEGAAYFAHLKTLSKPAPPAPPSRTGSGPSSGPRTGTSGTRRPRTPGGLNGGTRAPRPATLSPDEAPVSLPEAHPGVQLKVGLWVEHVLKRMN